MAKVLVLYYSSYCHFEPARGLGACRRKLRISPITPADFGRALHGKVRGAFGHAGQMTLDEITGGSPYGATAIAGSDGSRQPTTNDLIGARTKPALPSRSGNYPLGTSKWNKIEHRILRKREPMGLDAT